MKTGGGYTNLCNTMGAMGVPVMAKGNFIRTEASIGEWWREKLNESLIEAGRELENSKNCGVAMPTKRSSITIGVISHRP